MTLFSTEYQRKREMGKRDLHSRSSSPFFALVMLISLLISSFDDGSREQSEIGSDCENCEEKRKVKNVCYRVEYKEYKEC